MTKKNNRMEKFISVDVESSGPIPGEYSLLSLGACVVKNQTATFYREFKPITDHYIPRALAVSGLSLQKLEKEGIEPAAGMAQFEEWIKKVVGEERPIFTAFNATFDWMFVSYYFHKFLGRNPFGVSGLDIKAYYMGKFRTSWGNTAKSKFDPQFLSKKKHTHNALDDAIEQAEIIQKLLASQELLLRT